MYSQSLGPCCCRTHTHAHTPAARERPGRAARGPGPADTWAGSTAGRSAPEAGTAPAHAQDTRAEGGARTRPRPSGGGIHADARARAHARARARDCPTRCCHSTAARGARRARPAGGSACAGRSAAVSNAGRQSESGEYARDRTGAWPSRQPTRTTRPAARGLAAGAQRASTLA